MKRWEYLVAALADEASRSEHEEELRLYGETGWELVALVEVRYGWRAYLKRPKGIKR